MILMPNDSLARAGSQEINDLAQLLDCVADVLWCTVCACMQTQHKQVCSKLQYPNRQAAK